jgi:hypothetical protein
MGRPKIDKEQVKSSRIMIRFTKTELKNLEEAAVVCGIATANLIRDKVLKGHFPKQKVSKINLQVYLELKKSGVNINQLAKAVNSGRLPVGNLPVLRQLYEQQQFIIKLLLNDSQSKNR